MLFCSRKKKRVRKGQLNPFHRELGFYPALDSVTFQFLLYCCTWYRVKFNICCGNIHHSSLSQFWFKYLALIILEVGVWWTVPYLNWILEFFAAGLLLFIPKPEKGWGWEDTCSGFLLTNCVSLFPSGITMTAETQVRFVEQAELQGTSRGVMDIKRMFMFHQHSSSGLS